MRCLLILVSTSVPTLAADYASHPPMRPLPDVSRTPLGDGPRFYVDPVRGDDARDGSREKPWRTIGHALLNVQAGDTLLLRGGTYYEHVDVPVSGTEERPIVVRAHPGERAVIDGGLREFFDDPRTAWTPLENGAEHEYVSTRTYPAYRRRPILNSFPHAGWEPFHGKEDERPAVMGFFGDSLVPLHGYRTLADEFYLFYAASPTFVSVIGTCVVPLAVSGLILTWILVSRHRLPDHHCPSTDL